MDDDKDEDEGGGDMMVKRESPSAEARTAWPNLLYKSDQFFRTLKDKRQLYNLIG